jgi:hypothetical protein
MLHHGREPSRLWIHLVDLLLPSLDGSIRYWNLMSLKHKMPRLLIATLAIGFLFVANSRVANSTIPSSADLRAAYQPSENMNPGGSGAQAQLGDAALLARLDLDSREFTEIGSRADESGQDVPRQEPGASASLVLIGFGFSMVGCAVLIRRGKPS